MWTQLDSNPHYSNTKIKTGMNGGGINDCEELKIVEVSNDITLFRSFIIAVMFMDY
jgi:hypothetical protein